MWTTLLLCALAGPLGPLSAEDEAEVMVALSMGDPPATTLGLADCPQNGASPSTGAWHASLCAQVAGETPADLMLDQVAADDFDLPVRVDARVEGWMAWFLGPGARVLASWRRRLPRYGPTIRSALAANGLPEDLVYLAMVESGLNPRAHSRAGAVGLWQIMPATAGDLGLEVDQRTDVLRSTRAAVRYLSWLHEQFGDWTLTMAAYNGGPGRLQQAVEAAGSRELGQLEAHISRETENYVPKIYAVAILDRYAERYGLDEVEVEEVEVVDTEGAGSSPARAQRGGP